MEKTVLIQKLAEKIAKCDNCDMDDAVQEAAEKTAAKLGITHYTIDYEAPAAISYDDDETSEVA